MGRYIVCTGIMLLHIHPFISSVFFLSNYQTLKFFVTFFSGNMRPRRLKRHTLVDSGQTYRVYRNQAAAAYLSLYFSFFSLQFSNMKIFVTLFSKTVRSRRLKLVTHVEIGGCIVYTRIMLLLLFVPLFFSFFFLSNFQT